MGYKYQVGLNLPPPKGGIRVVTVSYHSHIPDKDLEHLVSDPDISRIVYLARCIVDNGPLSVDYIEYKGEV